MLKNLLLFVLLFTFLGFQVKAQKTVAFIVNDEGFSTIQTGLIDALEASGYTVTIVSTTIPFDFDALSTYGVVIISRCVYSGQFSDYESWANLDVPVLALSPYVLGYDALGYMAVDWTATGTSLQGTATTITKAAPLINDDIFAGVTSDSTAFDCYTYFYNIPPYKIADFNANDNTGKPMVVIANGSELGGDSAVVMARWDAGVETFPESGVVPSALRSFLSIGADIWQGPVNYDNYTPESLRLFINEVDYLNHHSKNGITAIKGVTHDSGNIAVYPNPVTDGNFRVELNGTNLTSSQLAIYNIVGNLVYSTKVTGTSSAINTHLSSGVYIVKVETGKALYTKKIVMK